MVTHVHQRKRCNAIGQFHNSISPVLLELVLPNFNVVLTIVPATSTAIYSTLYLGENFAEILEAYDVLHYSTYQKYNKLDFHKKSHMAGFLVAGQN